MKTEENVYEETTRTEDTTAVEEGRASTVPGKFKDVDALARAYGSLQAEFTRRSQRLKELERMAENFEKGVPAHSGVEKLRKNAKARKEEAERFDQFVAETIEIEGQGKGEPLQNSADDQPSNEVVPVKGNAENGDTMSALTADLDGHTGVEDGMETGIVVKEGGEVSQDDLYAQVCRNEEVRLKIIGEYLNSLGKRSAPLMTGGAGLLATPPQKPKSISDAGNMALLYFKKPKVN